MGVDSVTWQALGLVLTLLGLGTSAFIWSRRGPARGLRAVAWSLLPLAAALTGTLRLAGDVVSAVGRWSTRLVFDPLTWTGFVVAGVAVLLFLVSGRMLQRQPRPEPRRSRGRPAVADDRQKAGEPRAVGRGKASGSGTGDPELDEIEQILRRRGIT
jgi:membrane protein implicated in regulation of membrane protease activity